MPNYRYSRLQNDLDDEEEDAQHQQPSALESSSSSSAIKDSYRLRLVISGGIITMLIITFVGFYFAKMGNSICQMVCINRRWS
ncbi:hypothetical protein DPV78_012254 [Talaromyces pinophilus]|jgi:hypothetical protein|nr:hypothetical protein DPV78_012254 [Talaromyces pinophilus]